jgi:trehalose 6-phosphate phosphatase
VLVPRTAAGREGLTALRDRPAGALYALDYDGTLAPIVDRPEDAVPQPGAVAALERLPGRVALLTGRPAAVVVELGGLAQVPGLVVLGQYGVQRWEAGALVEEPPLPGLPAARAQLLALATEPGLLVEDKGHSLVVHARLAADGALDRVRAQVAAVAADGGFELHEGRLVLELRPPGHDKGRALRSLAAGATAVLYAGDDVGDLAGYDAVEELRTRGVPGLLVCSDSAEGPAELRRRADLVVPGPPGVVALLAELAAG